MTRLGLFSARFSAAFLLPCCVLAGCNAAGNKTDTAAAVEMPSGPVEGMRSLPHPVDTVGILRAHLAQLSTTSGDSLKALVPVDSALVAMFIAHCEGMMRSMNMTRAPSWTSTVAALADDAAKMRTMSPTQLASFMPLHRTRIEALLEMHRAMRKM